MADLFSCFLFSPASLDASLNDIAPGVDARDGPPGMGVDWLDEAVVDGESGASFGLAAIVELIGDLPVFSLLVVSLRLLSSLVRVCPPTEEDSSCCALPLKACGERFPGLDESFPALLHRSSRLSLPDSP